MRNTKRVCRYLEGEGTALDGLYNSTAAVRDSRMPVLDADRTDADESQTNLTASPVEAVRPARALVRLPVPVPDQRRPRSTISLEARGNSNFILMLHPRIRPGEFPTTDPPARIRRKPPRQSTNTPPRPPVSCCAASPSPTAGRA